MNQKELKELIEFLIEKGIAEFELERGDFKVRVKRQQDTLPAETRYVQVAAATPAGHESAAAAAAAGAPAHVPPTRMEAAEEEGLHNVNSPIVGTFYEAPSPGSPPFVKAGDTVEVGQVLCIIEAMKLMNEIESDMAGEVVKKLATNGQPVEFGQTLFSIRPRS
jgi:acetyl-CoA carboxylase biotin carboxyl carrier protein